MALKRMGRLALLRRARQYSIRSRISIALMLVVAIFIPVTIGSLYYVNQLFGYIKVLTERNAKFARMAEDIQVSVLESRQGVESFLLTGEEFHIEQHHRQIEHILENLAELRKTSRGLDADELEQLEGQLRLYDTNVSLLFSNTSSNENRNIAAAKTKSKEFRKQLEELLKRAQRQGRRETAKPSVASQGSPIADPDRQMAEAVEAFEEFMLSLREQQDPEMARLMTSIRQIDDRVTQLLGSIASRNWARFDENRRQAELARARAERNVLTGFLVTMLIAVYLFISLPNRIVSPIQRLTGMARRGRDGEIVKAPEAGLVDEVGALARAHNELLEHFRHLDELKTTKIKERTRALDILLEHADVAVAIVNEEGLVQQWSPPFARLVGQESNALAQQPVTSLLSLFPAEVERFEEMLQIGAERNWNVKQTTATGKPKELNVRAVPSTEDIHPARVVLFFSPTDGEVVPP